MKNDARKDETINPADKIGKYVRTYMRNLSNQGYVFSSDMLGKLTDSNSTKALFGIGTPFFKEIVNTAELSAQTKDSKGQNRYWKEFFEFNGKKYLIVSQWSEGNRERFDKWINSL